MPKTAWQLLGEYLRETSLLGSIQSTLYWDQNTSMPPSGASWRGEQLSLLARQLHKRNSSDELIGLVNNAKIELDHNKKDLSIDASSICEHERNIHLIEQDIDRQRSLDPDLVVQIAKAKANGYMLWQQAKTSNNFTLFAPALKSLIELRQEQSSQLDEPMSCWETLAQPYEPGISIARINELFLPLRSKLPELIHRVSSLSQSGNEKWDLSFDNQQRLSEQLLNLWCRDTRNTFVSNSPHPFSITLGPNDFRITTRVVKGQPLSCFLATAHEWGHSLYEQGLPSEFGQWFAWPLGQATSMAVHESQSLFWENRIARSFEFSKSFWKYFKEVGAPMNSAEDLWVAMNPCAPGLNRVEADEFSYGLHIMIRTDLEIDLLENGLPVEDLPNEWNKRYKELIGIGPMNDSEGCLQDVHWSEGMFGYFPSYLIGHLISAQLTKALEDQIGQIGDIVDSGDIEMILSWLRKNVHHYGRLVNAEELVQNVTHEPLKYNYFIDYLQDKIIQLEQYK